MILNRERRVALTNFVSHDSLEAGDQKIQSPLQYLPVDIPPPVKKRLNGEG